MSGATSAVHHAGDQAQSCGPSAEIAVNRVNSHPATRA